MSNSQKLIEILKGMVIADNNDYSEEEKREIFDLIIELEIAEKNNKKPNWEKVVKKISRVFLAKEIFEFITELFL